MHDDLLLNVLGRACGKILPLSTSTAQSVEVRADCSNGDQEILTLYQQLATSYQIEMFCSCFLPYLIMKNFRHILFLNK